jgi:predicted exporter
MLHVPVVLLVYAPSIRQALADVPAGYDAGALTRFFAPTEAAFLLPVLLGYGWMLGLMGWLGIPFNPVNIASLALVVGIGVTNGVHILNRFVEEANPVVLTKSTGKAGNTLSRNQLRIELGATPTSAQ